MVVFWVQNITKAVKIISSGILFQASPQNRYYEKILI